MPDGRHTDRELEQLTAYIDGELPETERAEVERWIANDPQGARLFEELRQTSQKVRSLPKVAAPPDLATRIADQLEREALLGDAEAIAGTTRKSPHWLKTLSLAAGFVLLVTAGWFLLPTAGLKKETTLAIRAPRATPLEKTETATSAEETTLALGASKDERGLLKRRRAKVEREVDADSTKKRGDETAPLALAPTAPTKQSISRPEPTAETAAAASRFADLAKSESGNISPAGHAAGIAGQPPTPTSAPVATSAPTTSAPTTTSAPATSQPTTRSASGG